MPEPLSQNLWGWSPGMSYFYLLRFLNYMQGHSLELTPQSTSLSRGLEI